MAKQKTHKALTKRFKVAKSGQVTKKAAGQGHFNSRESGKVGRNKKRDKNVSSTITKTIQSNV